jgi:hypothetical protein
MPTNDQCDPVVPGAAPKPGFLTTEFALTVAHQLLMAGFFFKLLPAKDAQAAQTTVDMLVPALGIAVSSAATVVAYVYSRVHVKTSPVVPIPVPMTESDESNGPDRQDPTKPTSLLGALIQPARRWPFGPHGRRQHPEPDPQPTPRPGPWRPRPPIVPPTPTPIIPPAPVPTPVVPPAPIVPPAPTPAPVVPPAPKPVFRPDDPDVHEGELIR